MSNGKKRRLEEEKEQLNQRALELLRSPDLLPRYLDFTERSGLVGEERNALAIFTSGCSRFHARPLNILVKAPSSAGKNFVVDHNLKTFPEDAVRTLTSSSDRAWDYSEDYFEHRIAYIKERNEASGAIHPARLLISEGKLERIVTVNVAGRWMQKKFVAKGPIAAISTTTKNHLEIDDETRHLSIWIDESPEQTRRIIAASANMKPRPSEGELNIWRAAHGLMEQRAAEQIVLPEWFDHIHSNVYIGDLRVRRYFPTFVTICQTIAMLRSFQPQREALLQTKGIIEVDFSDYAIAVRIFEPIFVHSIHHADDCAMQTRAIIKRISVRQGGTGVGVDDFAKEASISRDQAYARLATAAEADAICRANKPEKTNRKLYLPSSLPRFLPHPDRVFQEVRCIGDFEYVDPLRDEWVRGRR